MVNITATIAQNEAFSQKLAKYIHSNAFKYSEIAPGDSLVCNDGQYLLQRKITSELRLGRKSKAVFVHGYDPATLFSQVVKESVILPLINEYISIDLYILADVDPTFIEKCIHLISQNQLSIFHVRTQAELKSKLFTSRGDKKIIINFEPDAKYLPSDVYVYFCFTSSDEEIRQMFHLSADSLISDLMIIDTVSQRCPSGLKFIGKNDIDIFVQQCATFFTLKNCTETGKSLFSMLFQILLTYLKHVENNNNDNYDEEQEEEMDARLKSLIGQITAAYVDRSENSYIMHFFNTYIGHLENVYSCDKIWWNVLRCHPSLKMAVFIYTRTVPDFREILSFCNAWRYSNNDKSSSLVVVILVSPVIQVSALESLNKYNTEFNWLLKMASSANCCHGTHCERTLLNQYFINECVEDNSSEMENLNALQLIVKSIQKLEQFVISRDISNNRIFHESEMLKVLPKNPIAEDLAAAFLYRAIPLIGKDGLQKICVPFLGNKNIFIIKNDFQKYINVTTLTGIEFNGEVNRIINKLQEEYES